MLRQIMSSTQNLNIARYQRGPAARERDDVIKMEIVSAAALYTLALVALPDL
jgi:hypothetical protein